MTKFAIDVNDAEEFVRKLGEYERKWLKNEEKFSIRILPLYILMHVFKKYQPFY
jgi:hypothetical protein